METQKSIFLHVVATPTTLSSLAKQLYESTSSPIAQDFLRINRVAADRAGQLLPGQILYLPEPVCHATEMEPQAIELIEYINHVIVHSMSAEERMMLANHTGLIDNAAQHPGLIEQGTRIGNTVASGLVASVSLQSRQLRDILKGLESKYVQSFRAHGELTPQFYAQRRIVYQQLDTAMGRLARTLSLGTPIDLKARQALKVRTKSQLLEWRRNGTAAGVTDLQPHFGRIQNVTRYLKGGGYLTIGIDGYLTYDTITNACSYGDDKFCHRTAATEGGRFAGNVAGGALGGGAAYVGCNALFGAPTVGSSVLWCGLIAGPIGGLIGGTVLGEGGAQTGSVIHELTYTPAP